MRSKGMQMKIYSERNMKILDLQKMFRMSVLQGHHIRKKKSGS